MTMLREGRRLQGLPFPVPEPEVLGALSALARDGYTQLNSLIGLAEDASAHDGYTAAWIAVNLVAEVDPRGSPETLRSFSEWYEGASHLMNERHWQHEFSAAHDSELLRGWQTSEAWLWMEAADQVVTGTVVSVLGGALLAAATLVLFTRSLWLSAAAFLGVVVVLICFLGYLQQRGLAFGVVESIATTIAIGFACDYCVHVLKAHQNGGYHFETTLSHAAPSLVGAALITAGSTVPLFYSEFASFRAMGEYICMSIVFSWLAATTLIAPLIIIATDSVCAHRRGQGPNEVAMPELSENEDPQRVLVVGGDHAPHEQL